VECVRAGRTRCDVMSPSNEEILRIGDQYRRMEEEMFKVEEEPRVADLKVERLRK